MHFFMTVSCSSFDGNYSSVLAAHWRKQGTTWTPFNYSLHVPLRNKHTTHKHAQRSDNHSKMASIFLVLQQTAAASAALFHLCVSFCPLALWTPCVNETFHVAKPIHPNPIVQAFMGFTVAWNSSNICPPTWAYSMQRFDLIRDQQRQGERRRHIRRQSNKKEMQKCSVKTRRCRRRGGNNITRHFRNNLKFILSLTTQPQFLCSCLPLSQKEGTLRFSNG